VLAALLYRRVHHVNRRLAHNHDVLRRQSLHDPLTGLANRRALAEALPGEATGGLLLVDIDHFKRINDECGHAAGDAVLVDVAQRLLACVRAGDLVVRWGGEEFLIHAPGLDAAATEALADRVCQAVAARPVALETGPRAVTVSVGHGSFPLAEAPGPMPTDRAIHLVDMALYGAKNQGRNRSVGVAQALAADAAAPPVGDTIDMAR
jgi:diguanylate cyclase (GGDEF)-like protein